MKGREAGVRAFKRLRARLETPAEDLAWILVLVAALVLAAALAWLAPPLSKLYPKPAGDLFQVWHGAIHAEPLEETRSILVLAAPFVAALILLAIGTTRPARAKLDPLIIATQVAGAVLLVVALLNQPQTGALLSPDYFHHYLVATPNLVAGAILGIGATIAILRPPTWRWIERLRRAVAPIGGWTWVAVAIAVIATAIWLLPGVYTDATVAKAGPLASGHIPVQGEDYLSVANGRTPLVDYISQYANLLPILVEPALRAFGPSITSLSIAVTVLSGLAMLAIFGVFAQVTRRAWTALLLYVPWVALGLFPWHDFGAYREFNGIYYGVLPGRYFGPFVLALLSAIWLRGRRRVPAYLLFLTAGLVLLNNYEFGLGALFALIAAMIAGWDRAVPLGRRVGDLLVHGALGLITALVLVCAITLIRTGELPDPALLTYFNRVFLRDSYGLYPMDPLGLHWLLYATYAGAIVLAAIRYLRRDPDRVLTGMLAFSAVFGLVTGMYFVGRSLQYQLMLLFPAWGFSLALVAWTAAHSLAAAAPDRLRLRRTLIPAAAALIGFGVMVATIDGFPQPLRQIDRLRDGGGHLDLGPTEQVVEHWTQPGDDILLIATPPDHLVADRTGVVNVSPLNGVTSLFSPAEANRAIDQLEDSGGNTVIERVSDLPPVGFAFGVPEFAAILRQRGYRLVAEYPGLHLRVWRRGPTDAAAARPLRPA
jgi:hypothetical protein